MLYNNELECLYLDVPIASVGADLSRIEKASAYLLDHSRAGEDNPEQRRIEAVLRDLFELEEALSLIVLRGQAKDPAEAAMQILVAHRALDGAIGDAPGLRRNAAIERAWGALRRGAETLSASTGFGR